MALQINNSNANIISSNSISMHGSPLLGDSFFHFQHADPESTQGGELKLASLGTFDSTNPFIIKGRTAYGIKDLVFEPLMQRNYSEPFSLYGLIAEKVVYPENRNWIEFHINKLARFSDGVQIKSSDILFSFEQLKNNGRPNHRSYYSKVENVNIISDTKIKFSFSDKKDRELALILGLMPILPQHIYKDGKFKEAKLDKPIGSGPYIVSNINQGKNITYIKNVNYWGKNLNINNGLNNFDKISIDYYLDDNSRFEAFKSGLFDFYQIWDPSRWNNLKNEKAVVDKKIILKEFDRETPAGMLGIALNTRNKSLNNIYTREALNIMFDFEWINKNLYHGLYKRTHGYYDNSYLSSINNQVSLFEKKIFDKFNYNIEESILYGEPYKYNTNRRSRYKDALDLLNRAGYELLDNKLIDKNTLEQLTLVFLISDKRQEKYALNFKDSLQKIGIDLRIELVDSTQYQKRKQEFDFDMVEHFWYASLSPGNEQYFYWGSNAANEFGSRNYSGIESPIIDATIDLLISSKSAEEFMYSVRALDRLLISGYYVVPLFHWPHQWVAISDRIDFPENTSIDGYKINTWSIKE
tara:strand:+ start:5941 stop:7686 length:1746 start_codon:yes stop_codon:yes gene_type:complete